MSERRAVVLLSGGLDSGTSLALWHGAGHAIACCLFVDYGQQARTAEARVSEALARRYDAPWQRVELPWLGDYAARAGCALVGADALPERTVEDPGDADSAARVWVPARNVVLISAAAAAAEVHGADTIVAGFNREEAETFPDNSADFVRATDAMLAFGTREGVRVESPTLALDKVGIVAAARESGLGPDDFWSCYRDGERPCGVCESCVRAKRAWSA